MSTILTGVDTQSEQLDTQYPKAGQDPDQTRQYLAQFLLVANTSLNDIKNLNPPDRFNYLLKLPAVAADLASVYLL